MARLSCYRVSHREVIFLFIFLLEFCAIVHFLDDNSSHSSPIHIRDTEFADDSTKEDKYEKKTPQNKIYSSRNLRAAKDMEDFRHSVQILDEDESDDDNEPGESRFYNLDFYHGQIKSSPDDVHIDDFHEKWMRDYHLLENSHYYIQWLFPIQERGVNWEAHVLTKKEIKAFRKDEEAKRKLVKSYELMLDFYGIRLVNKTTGEVERADNWRERFRNLNRYSHNNLRITRILKCLGTLGIEHYQTPLVKFFLHETLVEGQLSSVKQSVLDYFMFAVLDKSKRQELVRFACKYSKPQEQFVWCPKSGEVEEDGHVNKLREEHSENEKLTENRTAEDGQQRENKRRTVETGQQNPDKNSSNNKEAEKQDQETKKCVEPHECKGGINKIDANHPPEEMGRETPSKTNDKPDTPNKMTGNNIKCNQGENDSKCRSKNKNGKENQELIIDDDDDGSKKFPSGEVHSKNDNFSHLLENEHNSTHEWKQINNGKESGGKDQQVETG